MASRTFLATLLPTASFRWTFEQIFSCRQWSVCSVCHMIGCQPIPKQDSEDLCHAGEVHPKRFPMCRERLALINARFSECLLANLLVLTSSVLMSLSLTVLKRLQFHRTVLSFMMAVCFFCYVLTGTVIIYIKRTLFHFLSRAWSYNKFNVSLRGYLLFCQ